MGRVLALIAAALTLWTAPGAEAAGERRALLIGIGGYRDLPRLQTPPVDLAGVAEALRRNGVQVSFAADLGAAALRRAVGVFAERLDGADVGLIYYTGYRTTVDGRDYLLAADALPEAARGADAGRNLAVAAVLGALERSTARRTALVLNVFSPGGRKGDSAQRRPSDLPPGVAVLYGAGPDDGGAYVDGRSLFADTFIKALTDSGPTVSDVFGRTARDVARLSGGGQTPWQAVPMDFRLAPSADDASTRQGREAKAGRGQRTVRPAAAPVRPAGGAPQTMPAFPWPPPQPTAFGVISRYLAAPDGGRDTLGGVADRIDGALQTAGYAERSFHAVPNGYAMVTRLERIRPDGRPDAERRWFGAAAPEEFSLSRYIQTLFFGDPGRYRLIVFVVTDETFAATGKEISSDEGERLLRGGFVTLPPRFNALPFTPNHKVTALVYEFEKPEGGEAKQLARSRLSALDHLNGAALLDALSRR